MQRVPPVMSQARIALVLTAAPERLSDSGLRRVRLRVSRTTPNANR